MKALELNNKCYQLGVKAFHNNILSLVFDDEMMNIIYNNNSEVGSNVNIMKAWNDGWTDTHIIESDKELKELGLI